MDESAAGLAWGGGADVAFGGVGAGDEWGVFEVAGGLGKGTVPSSTVIDAQVGYKIINAHSTIKLGATNLTNQYYSTGIANPMIGGMYYISLGYNLF